MQYIRIDEQIADILTKPLTTSKFVYFRDKLGMAENASLVEHPTVSLNTGIGLEVDTLVSFAFLVQALIP